MTTVVSPWPAGAKLQGVRFVPRSTGIENRLFEFPSPINQVAVAIGAESGGDLELLTIAMDDRGSNESGNPDRAAPDWGTAIRAWLGSASGDLTGYQLIVVHGAEIHYCSGRLVVIADTDRLEAVRNAALETIYYELELRSLENRLAEFWPAVEADTPLAFEFRERDLKRSRQLAARFHELLLARSRLARITPRLMIPPIYPPTLPGQVQERLRERLGVGYRLEALEVQFEMFERVYDGCAQRASDYALARKSLVLEWVIIILLLAQTILVLFEFLTNAKG